MSRQGIAILCPPLPVPVLISIALQERALSKFKNRHHCARPHATSIPPSFQSLLSIILPEFLLTLLKNSQRGAWGGGMSVVGYGNCKGGGKRNPSPAASQPRSSPAQEDPQQPLGEAAAHPWGSKLRPCPGWPRSLGRHPARHAPMAAPARGSATPRDPACAPALCIHISAQPN